MSGKEITENDFAYLAGLIDGEGSIYYKKTKQLEFIFN